MSPPHPPTLLLLTLLSTLLPLALAGGSTSPRDFNEICVNTVRAGEFPDSQQTFADLDLYDGARTPQSIDMSGWQLTDEGVCDYSLITCNNLTGADSNLVKLQSIDYDFYNDLNEPLYLETLFVCDSGCQDCVLNVEFIERGPNNTVVDFIQYFCNDTEQTPPLFDDSRGNIRIEYRAVFSNSTDLQCISITRFRLYQYADCPSIFNLAQYSQTDPGIGPVDAEQCVANAMEPANVVQAGCIDTSSWEQVSADVCQCVAGFEPDPDLTECTQCMDGYFKAGVGNDPCMPCPPSQVSTQDRTDCMCEENRGGGDCSGCIENTFMLDNNCVNCPSGSVRPANSLLMNSCSCTGNLVTANGVNTTMASSDDCIMCDTDFFKFGEMCMRCPSGSGRTVQIDEGSCTCQNDMVTSAGNVNTTFDNCVAVEIRFSAAAYTFIEGDLINLTLSALPPPSKDIEITIVATMPDTGFPDTDVTIPASQSGVTVSIQLMDNTIAFNDPILSSIMFDTDANVDKSMNTATFQINDDDVVVAQFEQTSYEADEDAGSIEVCVTINAAAIPVDITITGVVVLAPDSPSAPSVGTLNQMLTFAPGRTKECLMINIIDDEVAGEADEQYRLSLQADDVRVMVMTPGGEADVIIRDDDTEGVVVAEFEQTSYGADEDAGSIEVCVTINEAAIPVDITVIGVVVLAPDSPSAPSVGTLNQTLTFAPGRTKECLMINIIDDEVAGEADEQYRLSLQADDVRVMVMTPGGEADVIIRDDDTEGDAFPIEAVIGACVGGAVLAVIAAILCLLCLCVWRFYVKRRGFYHTNEDSQAAPTMLRYSASLRSISSQSVVVAEGKQATQKENEFFV